MRLRRLIWITSLALASCSGGGGGELDDPDLGVPDGDTSDGDGGGPVTECNDGIDNDADGFVDLEDIGCANAEDDNEVNTTSTTECSDKKDNDGDGFIDLDDSGCVSAGDDDERNVLTGECGDGVSYFKLGIEVSVSGTNSSGTGDFQGSCGGFGRETIYLVTIPEDGTYVFSTVDEGTTLDTVVYVRTDCVDEGSEIACNDQGSDPPASTAFAYLEAGEVFVIVDTWGTGDSGSYVLRVTTRLDSGEVCDPELADQCAPGLLCREDANLSDGTYCLDPVCSDGTDDDDDGLTDFPFDPGCSSESDADESDGCPDDCPECSDGEDNDMDGDTDYPDDPGCASASDDEELDECIPGVYAVELTDDVVSGSISSGSSNFSGSCGYSTTTYNEDVYALRVGAGATLLETWTSGSSANTVLYVRTECGETSSEVECKDIGGNNESISIDAPDAGNYYIFVDANSSGSYTLHAVVTLSEGAACVADSDLFVCEAGFGCGPTTLTCDASLCNDGLDNDGDSLIDYPLDPGCSSIDDAAEDDPCPGAGCPACFDTVDNDADGLVDYPEDTGCNSAADDSEIDLCTPDGDEAIELPASGTDSGDTTGQGDDTVGTCGETWDSDSPEVVYVMQLPGEAQTVNIGLESVGLWEPVLYVRQTNCESGTQVACDGETSCGGNANVIMSNAAAGTYYVFVDGWYYCYGDEGNYSLTVTALMKDGEGCDPAAEWQSCNPGFACQETSSGSGVWACLGTQCNDSDDNDADGFSDYPMDFGCDSTEDVTETSTACSNGADNDLDGLVDYPNDPGCSDPYDNSEADPPTLPDCADGAEDDSDGLTDYPADPGCYSASDPTEADGCGFGIAYPDLTTTRAATGSTAAAPDVYAPSTCATTSTAPDHVYLYRVVDPQPSSVETRSITVSLNNPGTDFDTVLFVRSTSCADGSEVACNNNFAGDKSQVTFDHITSATPGEYYIFVTGAAAASGNYELTIFDTLE